MGFGYLGLLKMPTLIQQLVKEGLLEKEKASSLEFSAKTSNKTIEELIIEGGIVPEETLFKLKSKEQKIPLKRVSSEEISLKVLELIPEESSRYYHMIPLAQRENQLEIGMVYPEDLKTQEALKFLARQGKFSFKVFLITPTDFNNLLKKYRTLKKEVSLALEELEVEMGRERPQAVSPEAEDFERLAEEAPITKVVAVLLRHAVEGDASDIHIEPGRSKTRVRFRLDGILHASIFLPARIHPAVIARIKILADLKIDETRIPQDGRFSTKITERAIDFRVSTFPTTLGEKVVIRILDPSKGLKTFEALGLKDRNLKVIQEATRKPYGMVLSTGPTGSGKSTTLYAILQTLNKEGVNIITLEDPVEYFVEGINQSQIKPDIGYTFASGLRHILRQDPNIIMVGEIRDEETASLATHAALTGHVVLSTLHTTSAIGAIPRLIDMGVRPFLIPSTLSVAIGQRLCRKLCPHCKRKVLAKGEAKEFILEALSNLPPLIKKEVRIPRDIYIYAPEGCKKCKDSGYSGRIGIFEVLSMNSRLAEIILKEPTESQILKEAKEQGMLTMQQDGVLKVLEGTTSIEEIVRVAEEK